MIKHWIEYTLTNFWAFVTGILGSIVAYFLPIKDIVNLMILFFIADSLIGFWAARKLRRERFTVSKIWNETIPRMFLSVILIMGLYLWEGVYYGITGHTYRIVGGFISGVLLISIAQNAYKITDWSVFIEIGKFIKKNKD